MAKEEGAAVSDGQGSGKSWVTLIVPILNTVALLGTLGVLYYSKLQYKRAPITEDGERTRLAKKGAAPPKDEVKGFLDFDPVTINIASNPDQPHAADHTVGQLQGKLHYATLGFTLEIRDQSEQEIVNGIRPLILDRVIHLLSKKHYHELATVQGRYILSTEIINFVNRTISSLPESTEAEKEGVVTHLYFTQFIVQ